MSLIPTVTMEQAALNALGRWLSAGLAGYSISYTWPAPALALPAKAITILRAGAREDEDVDPAKVDEEQIHLGVTLWSPAFFNTIPDLPTVLAVLPYLAGNYEAHRVSLYAHQAQDTVNVLTAPAATDLSSAITQAEDLRAKLNAHELATIPHPNPDTQDAVTVPTAVDLPSLLVLVNALNALLPRHYAARIDVWSLRGSRLPVQLDVWTTYEAVRDQTLALLEPLLNADPFYSAGIGWQPGQPGHNGVVVQLADGWAGVVDFDFQAPSVLQTDRSQQVSEFRATYTGVVDFKLLVKAQSARLAQIQLQAALDETTASRFTTVSASATENTG